MQISAPRPRLASEADRDRAAAEHRTNGVRVRAREDQIAGALLDQLADAAGRAAIGDRIGAGENQRAAPLPGGGNATSPTMLPASAAAADLQRPGADRRQPRVGMIAVEDQRAGTGLRNRAVAADDAIVDYRVRAAEDQVRCC